MFAEHQPFKQRRRAPLPLAPVCQFIDAGSLESPSSTELLLGKHSKSPCLGTLLSTWKSSQRLLAQSSPQAHHHTQLHGCIGRGQTWAPALLPCAPGRGVSGRAEAGQQHTILQHVSNAGQPDLASKKKENALIQGKTSVQTLHVCW